MAATNATDAWRAWLAELGYARADNPMAGRIGAWRALYEASGDAYESEETDERGNTFKVSRLSVHPAEMVCEDWASLLVNEDSSPADVVSVEGGDDAGGAAAAEALARWMSEHDFLYRARELVEDAMWSGTAAWSLRIDGMPADGTPSAAARFVPQRHDATGIVPLTYDGDECDEAAFPMTCTVRGEPRTLVTAHLRRAAGGREIRTAVFGADGGRIRPEGIADVVELPGVSLPTFSIVRPGIKNPYWPHSPFGVAVFDRAAGAVAVADDAVDNMHRDIYLGQKMLGLPEWMLKRNDDGTYTVPRARDQQLFMTLADEGGVYDRGSLGVTEYNPDLRMADNRAALKTALELLGLRCGLGKDYYGLDQSGHSVARTATEVASSERVLLRNAEKHKHVIESAMARLLGCVLELHRTVGGMAHLPDRARDVRVRLADAIITDDAAERATDLADVAAGIMAAWEYRAKWYAEDEATARAMAGEAAGDIPVM